MPVTFPLLTAALHRWQRRSLARVCVCVAAVTVCVSWRNVDVCVDNRIPVHDDDQ